MIDNVTRLNEAQKQIQIVAEKIEDGEDIDDLESAEALVEGVKEALDP